MSHHLFVPKQAVGANLVYFDLFNASDKNVIVSSVRPVVSGAVAVVGVVGVDLLLTYTSAIGTGGTAATRNATDTTAMTFARENPIGQDVPTTVTARLTPTGGATAAGVISWESVFTEETNSATYLDYQLLDSEIIVPSDYGIRVVQGAVASVGNIGFVVALRMSS